MTEKHTMEILRQVWNNEDGSRYEVGPDKDVGGWTEVRAYEKDAEKPYVRFVLPPDAALLLAKALIGCAYDLTDE